MLEMWLGETHYYMTSLHKDSGYTTVALPGAGAVGSLLKMSGYLNTKT